MAERSELSRCVTRELVKRGFSPEFSEIIGEQLPTDFTARQMLRYLREGKPGSMEEIADEMLAILEFRDRCVEKHILERRRF